MAAGKGTLVNPNDPDSDFAVSEHGRTRCTALSKQSRRRCKRWAVRGKDKCSWHGGASAAVAQHGRASKYLREAGFADAVEADASLDLTAELGLVRGLLQKACNQMEEIQTSESYTDKDRATLTNQCAAVMLGISEQIRKFVESSQRIKIRGDGMFSIDALKVVILNLVEIAEEVAGDETAERIVAGLRDRLPFPGDMEFLLRQRLQIAYEGEDGPVKLSADPYLSSLPPSQQHLASEIPGAGNGTQARKDALGSGEGGT